MSDVGKRWWGGAEGCFGFGGCVAWSGYMLLFCFLLITLTDCSTKRCCTGRRRVYSPGKTFQAEVQSCIKVFEGK